ncbi:TIGR00341 family protein [Enterococcus faecium]|nr:TIGR00341 family protein [Enterococcus faecium]
MMSENVYYSAKEFYAKINQDLTIRREDMVILVCSIVIACIGLNMDTNPVVIGAMLVSPLMTPIQGVGMGLSLFDQQMLKKALKILLVQIMVSIVTASIYFFISPISYASNEILARTQPTIWDVIIAFFGGIAGVIGSRKKAMNNIVAGVAIAAALMPPLCTVGYAIALKKMPYFLGAGYLFLINCFFIIIATFIGVQVMRIPKSVKVDSEEKSKMNVVIVILSIVILIPSIISASQLVGKSIIENGLRRMLSEELGNNVIVINKSIDQENKIIYLTTSGEKISDTRIKKIEESLPMYNLKGMSLEISQITNTQQLSGEDLVRLLKEYEESKKSNSIEKTKRVNSTEDSNNE